MKRALTVTLFLALAFPSDAEAQGLLRRVFGGGRQVQFQSNACYQQPAYQAPVYQAQYYQPNYVAVAAVPLATVPVAVDLQQYIYAVNASAFQSFREYQSQRATQPEPATLGTQPQPVSTVVESGLTGAAVLKKSCIGCHQAGNNPKSGFAMFDAKGELYPGLPFADIMERITAEEPSQRMPPKGSLAPHDAMAVLRLASSSVPTQERVAAVELTKPRNPFE